MAQNAPQAPAAPAAPAPIAVQNQGGNQPQGGPVAIQVQPAAGQGQNPQQQNAPQRNNLVHAAFTALPAGQQGVNLGHVPSGQESKWELRMNLRVFANLIQTYILQGAQRFVFEPERTEIYIMTGDDGQGNANPLDDTFVQRTANTKDIERLLRCGNRLFDAALFLAHPNWNWKFVPIPAFMPDADFETHRKGVCAAVAICATYMLITGNYPVNTRYIPKFLSGMIQRHQQYAEVIGLLTMQQIEAFDQRWIWLVDLSTMNIEFLNRLAIGSPGYRQIRYITDTPPANPANDNVFRRTARPTAQQVTEALALRQRLIASPHANDFYRELHPCGKLNRFVADFGSLTKTLNSLIGCLYSDEQLNQAYGTKRLHPNSIENSFDPTFNFTAVTADKLLAHAINKITDLSQPVHYAAHHGARIELQGFRAPPYRTAHATPVADQHPRGISIRTGEQGSLDRNSEAIGNHAVNLQLDQVTPVSFTAPQVAALEASRAALGAAAPPNQIDAQTIQDARLV